MKTKSLLIVTLLSAFALPVFAQTGAPAATTPKVTTTDTAPVKPTAGEKIKADATTVKNKTVAEGHKIKRKVKAHKADPANPAATPAASSANTGTTTAK